MTFLRSAKRVDLKAVGVSALIGGALGILVLGIGGRSIMRVIAHWEGRVPVLTLGGTVTVVFFGAMAGLAGGVVHGLLKSFVPNRVIRGAAFLLLCIAFTWRAVNALLPRSRLLFVALTLVYVIALEVINMQKGDLTATNRKNDLKKVVSTGGCNRFTHSSEV
ncbi:MAG: hypothetical protein ABI681_08185, partial [Gemmatimonadales bacterium]